MRILTDTPQFPGVIYITFIGSFSVASKIVEEKEIFLQMSVVPIQLQIVTIGLQDDFFHLGRKAKSEFLSALSAASAPGVIKPVIVDRINTMRSHRRDVFNSMGTVGIRVMIEWKLPASKCISRIKERKFGHRSIQPNDNAGLIVDRTRKDYEPLSDEEVKDFQIQKLITLEDAENLSREQVIKRIIDELAEFNNKFAYITEAEITAAVLMATRRERNISELNQAKETSANKITSYPSRVYEGRYELCIGDHEIFRRLYRSLKLNIPTVCKDEFHVTLLFIKKSLAKIINEASFAPQINIEPQSSPDSTIESARTYSPSDYRRAIELYSTMENQSIKLKMQYIAWNTRVVAVRVDFGDIALPHFDVIPHISVAKIREAEFRESNFLIESVDNIKKTGASEVSNVRWVDLDEESHCSGIISFRPHR